MADTGAEDTAAGMEEVDTVAVTMAGDVAGTAAEVGTGGGNPAPLDGKFASLRRLPQGHFTCGRAYWLPGRCHGSSSEGIHSPRLLM
jgi:hypothetical protein